ncbi:hypothetical protein NL676_013349 [Syzygium grande]|nr:hypothetical protein NL676_013349 [Syzygium grande]
MLISYNLGILSLRTAFRAKAMEFHPDRNQDKQSSSFRLPPIAAGSLAVGNRFDRAFKNLSPSLTSYGRPS